MSDTQVDNTQAEQPETLTKSEVFSFCRHLGRSLKNADSSDFALADKLMREAEYLEKNGFTSASEMFLVVSQTLAPRQPNS